MKLVDFETFNKMPAGTIFAPYEPSCLKEELAIKTDHGWSYISNGEERWCFNGVMPLQPWNLYDVFDEKSVKASFEIYDGDTHDYMDEKYILVFDECDIDRLIEVLQWAKAGCPDGVEDKFSE